MTRHTARRWLRPWSIAALHWAVVFPCYAASAIAEGVRAAARDARESIRSFEFEER